MGSLTALISILLIFTIYSTLVLAPDLLTYEQSADTVWWNDTVVINGSARYNNGTGIYSANVSITVGNVRCNNTTDSTGNYTCRFAAPQEVGKYNVSINITNSTGPSVTNATTLNVRLKYGDAPIGTVGRVVYETPVFIQELSGRIRILSARITVWRA